MTDSELLMMMKIMIKKELAKTLMGKITTTNDSYFTSILRFATDSEIDNLRQIYPYGFNSRPPTGTECVVHPINGDPSHLVVLGQFDNGNRPTLQPGESVMYGPAGQVIYMDTAGDVILGSYASDGTISANFKFKFSSDGSFKVENANGSITLKASGEIDLDGGGGATHGIGLGDVIENRLSALESAVTAIATNLASHVHPVSTAPGTTGPETPTADPFTPDATPAASTTTMVST